MNREILAKVLSVGGGRGPLRLRKDLKTPVLDPLVIEAPQQGPWISRLTAVATGADAGESSGRLREEFQILPPGDIRNCMAALSADESSRSKRSRTDDEGFNMRPVSASL
ncbi:MAG: YvcK family protein [Acidobacteria bacterium]|nr:YvcK family protein [Acidobacteriota bacterium]